MRTKALIIGATSPFLGPPVFIEKGDWLIECEDGCHINVIYNDDIYPNVYSITVQGPARLRVELVHGSDVSIEARQLAHA